MHGAAHSERYRGGREARGKVFVCARGESGEGGGGEGGGGHNGEIRERWERKTKREGEGHSVITYSCISLVVSVISRLRLCSEGKCISRTPAKPSQHHEVTY